MKTSTKTMMFALLLVATVVAILYLESQRPAITSTAIFGGSHAKEIVKPSGYINADNISVSGLVGHKVILVDFWTYSCINCLRTIPYLNRWYEMYGNQGLEIIGVHTPEFQFEHDYGNVLAAVKNLGIKYPVVLDNDYGTWSAYGNHYWPHKYLIDINGNVVYDHIGEGGYEETEGKIQSLLDDRMKLLNLQGKINKEITRPTGAIEVDFTRVNSPEVYFGAARNSYLSNGNRAIPGVQDLTEPKDVRTNELYLVGQWNFGDEYAENLNAGAKIIFRYDAKNVYLVAGATGDGVALEVLRDGLPLGEAAGKDIVNGTVRVTSSGLYRLVEDRAGYGIHTLEITAENPGLRAFTFTFG